MRRRRRWVENELVRLWGKAFGQPPAIMAEPRLMLQLLRGANDASQAPHKK